MALKMYKRLAKSCSYASTKRNKKDVLFIVLHYTGNENDTAKNNVDYFATSNTRQAGAHFFVDRQGNIGRSIPMDRSAWAVGGDQRSGESGEAKYFGKCTNYNSVSIEMCDIASKDPSEKQTKAVKELIEYIQKYCPNAKTIIRHWDVNSKHCPARMVGKESQKWKAFLKEIEPGVKTKLTGKLYKDCNVQNGFYKRVTKGSKVVFKKDMKNGWSEVSFGGQMGYMKNSCIDKSGLSTYKKATVTVKAPMRKKNKKGSKVLCYIPAGTEVTKVGAGKYWINIKYNGMDGFVFHTKIK